MVRSALLPAMASLLIVVGAPAAAQEIFYDGFDRGDLCAWSNPVTAIQEAEAFDQSGANDFEEDAEPIGRCAVVEGTIGDPYFTGHGQQQEWTFDSDWYEIVVDGPVLLQIDVERLGAGSPFQPFVAIYNSSDFWEFGYFPIGVPSGDPAFVTRQIFLPEDGFAYPLDPPEPSKDLPAQNHWYLAVEDDRNYSEPSCPCGDEANRYRLTLRVVPVVGPATPPLNEESVQMPADNSVLVYRIDGATVDTLDFTETILDQLNPGNTDLDTKLYLVRRAGTSLVTVAGDDDWAGDGFGGVLHKDSKIETTALTAHPHFVIVDWFSRASPDAIDFQLTIQFVQAFF